eukprot:6403768-Amphidinium_carterae.1
MGLPAAMRRSIGGREKIIWRLAISDSQLLDLAQPWQEKPIELSLEAKVKVEYSELPKSQFSVLPTPIYLVCYLLPILANSSGGKE